MRENFMHGLVVEVKLIPKRSFTLIEPLFVIAIIGIFMTILLPSLQKARMVKIRTACLNNEKQSYIANELYSGDNSDQLPSSRVADGDSSWDDLISKYVGRDISEFLIRHRAPTKDKFDNESVNN